MKKEESMSWISWGLNSLKDPFGMPKWAWPSMNSYLQAYIENLPNIGALCKTINSPWKVPSNLRTTLISLVVGGKCTRGWRCLVTACRSGCGNEDLGAETLVWSFAMIIMYATSARRAKETRIKCAFVSVVFDLNLCPTMKFYVYKHLLDLPKSNLQRHATTCKWTTLHQSMYLIISLKLLIIHMDCPLRNMGYQSNGEQVMGNNDQPLDWQ